jgi:hypothetical protein
MSEGVRWNLEIMEGSTKKCEEPLSTSAFRGEGVQEW